MQKGEGSRRVGNQHHAKEAADWAEMGPGQSAQAGPAHSGAQSAPFDLAAIQTIYIPEAKSHGGVHSSSVAEE
jgi:hypothetical protein